MEKKIPFFKRIIISIKDLDKYSLLISEKMRRSIIYLLEIMIIFSLIISGILTYKTNNLIKDIANGNKIETPYDNLLTSSEIDLITKNDIISLYNDYKGQINCIIYLSTFGTTYIIYTLSTFIDALALSLLVIIISKMAKISLKYSQALTIGISSLTLPIILNLIYTSTNLLNGFYMEHFQVMYALISYIYVVAVILIMRTDLIKKKQLIKATIEIKELEKRMENRDNKEEKEDKEENKEQKNNEEQNENGNKLNDVKRKTKGKEGPEPQANIEGGK